MTTAPPPPRTPARRAIGMLLIALCLLLLAPGAIVAALRLVRQEYGAGIVSAEAALPYLLLPAYLTLLVALVRRARLLAVLSVALVAAHLVWLSPSFLSSQSLTAAERSAPTVRVYSHNIKYDNERPEDLAASIKQANADVVMLEELTLSGQRTLEASGALDPYPYKAEAAAGTDGLGLWSKTPLRDARIVPSPGFPSLRAVTSLQGRDVALYAIHTRAPVNGNVRYWHEDLAQLQRELRAETLPVIAAGDYNATFQHRPFRDLLSAGFVDAAAADGRGWARTWPVDNVAARVGGLIQLDHVVVSDDTLRVRPSAELDGGGSDHRAIYADLTFAQG